jgi:hypothetical protein
MALETMLFVGLLIISSSADTTAARPCATDATAPWPCWSKVEVLLRITNWTSSSFAKATTSTAPAAVTGRDTFEGWDADISAAKFRKLLIFTRSSLQALIELSTSLAPTVRLTVQNHNGMAIEEVAIMALAKIIAVFILMLEFSKKKKKRIMVYEKRRRYRI